ncbi:metalloregulator ArsR/SmtB family transcription factor [Kutzneria sp. 744]|uniref:helix-turn-helix transcriptional regulator n=1 Tax=Kutzneria sp. (strain 744) TaxID=345341 RepID=UPI0003EEE19A|nr:helix-turn-helix domain-containing protein [Kutzneria sp. 744]EWM19195.1 regulatory protein ArsR [Kutzneria sp. 744]
MSELTLTDPGVGPVLGESRGRVLDMLRAAGGPVGVQDIAEHAGLHPNTARFHLDGLVDAGLAQREAEERSQPGRPRMVYRAVATDVPAGQRSYRLLAEMLTSLVADALPQSDQAAVTAGEAWGRYLAERPAPSQRVDVAEGVRRLSTVLADAGFAPDVVDDPVQPVIRLRHCPFREVAEQHREVVCSLHLGLMRGVLAEVRAPLKADRLEPFVERSLCLAHLTPVARQPTGADGTATTKGRRQAKSRR